MVLNATPVENHRPGQLLIKGTLSGSLKYPLYTKDRRGHNSMIVEFPMQSVPITTCYGVKRNF
jgi:hypothetical protein